MHQILVSKLADSNTNKLFDNDINDLRSILSNMSLHNPCNFNLIGQPKVDDPRKFTGVNDYSGKNRLENFITQFKMVIRLQSSHFPDKLSNFCFTMLLT